MLTLKELTENYSCFVCFCIEFKSQSEVVYSLGQFGGNYRFSKADLIACIKYYLGRLELLSDISKIKHGFVLDKFKYYELSVYLHGLLQVYCRLVGLAPINELFIKKFSHLPHDVMKPEKQIRHIMVSYLTDGYDDTHAYCCVIAGVPLCADTYEGLMNRISHVFSGFVKQYDIILDIK